MTRALNEPRKPPKESVRLSTERGEAAASGERSLAMASCWCTRLSADGFLWLSMLPSESARWCRALGPALQEVSGDGASPLQGLTRPPGCARSAACCARLSHLRSQTSVLHCAQRGAEGSPWLGLGFGLGLGSRVGVRVRVSQGSG